MGNIESCTFRHPCRQVRAMDKFGQEFKHKLKLKFKLKFKRGNSQSTSASTSSSSGLLCLTLKSTHQQINASTHQRINESTLLLQGFRGQANQRINESPLLPRQFLLKIIHNPAFQQNIYLPLAQAMGNRYLHCFVAFAYLKDYGFVMQYGLP